MAIYRSDQAQLTFAAEAAPGGGLGPVAPHGELTRNSNMWNVFLKTS